MARLYSNENIPFPVVEELRNLGHDVLTVFETGKAGQSWPDESVLEFAMFEGRCVLTVNRRHFVRLHGLRPDHAGIIVCTFDPDFGRWRLESPPKLKSATALPASSCESIGRPNNAVPYFRFLLSRSDVRIRICELDWEARG
ncbi:MAG: DUF5615 family PIN-like protein [Planctomycetota bacterium]